MRGRPLTWRPTLTPQERHALEAWTNDAAVADLEVRHARVVLLVAQGMAVKWAARRVGLSRKHATKWLRRWHASGIAGLRDKRHANLPVAARRARAAEEAVMQEWERA